MSTVEARTTVVRRPTRWDAQVPPLTWPWAEIAPLPPLWLADGSQIARQQTAVRLCHDQRRLYVHFACDDDDIWGSYTDRDDPIYDEEVVEIFLAPGPGDPVDYAELEISPCGVLLDAWITNPTGDRAEMVADFGWDCPDIVWHVERDDANNRWAAAVVLPFNSLAESGEQTTTWRANFYRIERPRGREAEFSCWSPTLTTPADFHKPARFGLLTLG